MAAARHCSCGYVGSSIPTTSSPSIRTCPRSSVWLRPAYRSIGLEPEDSATVSDMILEWPENRPRLAADNLKTLPTYTGLGDSPVAGFADGDQRLDRHSLPGCRTSGPSVISRSSSRRPRSNTSNPQACAHWTLGPSFEPPPRTLKPVKSACPRTAPGSFSGDFGRNSIELLFGTGTAGPGVRSYGGGTQLLRGTPRCFEQRHINEPCFPPPPFS